MIDAEGAQTADPGEDRCGVESELSDDVDFEPGRLRGIDLVQQEAIELLRGEPWVTIGVAGDADLDDAVPLQPSAVNHVASTAKIASRRIAVAGNDQHAPHASFTGGAHEKVFERRCTRKAAYCQMWHRLESRPCEPGCRRDCFPHRPPWDGAEVDAHSRGSNVCEHRDIIF